MKSWFSNSGLSVAIVSPFPAIFYHQIMNNENAPATGADSTAEGCILIRILFLPSHCMYFLLQNEEKTNLVLVDESSFFRAKERPNGVYRCKERPKV